MLGKLLLRFLEHYKLGWILLQLRKWMKPGENPIRIAFPSRKNLMPSPFNPLKLSRLLLSRNRCPQWREQMFSYSARKQDNKRKETGKRERISSSQYQNRFHMMIQWDFFGSKVKATSIVKVCFLTGLQIGCLTKTLHVLLTWKIIFSLKEYWLQYLSGQVKALNLLAVTEGLVMIVIQTTRRGG